MYTFSPIAAIDTVNNHTGLFLVIAGAITITVILSLSTARGEKIETFLGLFFVGTLISIGAAMASYNTGELVIPKNEPVTATFVSFQPEGYNDEQRNGKYTRRVDVHKMYVVYSVNDQNVILPAVAGGSYPNTITLYKN